MPELNSVDKKRKNRLIISRLCGIVVSIAILTLLLAFYFSYVDQWVTVICVIMLSAVNFIVNGVIIDTKTSSNWIALNMIMSSLFFATGLVILIFGLLSGDLILF